MKTANPALPSNCFEGISVYENEDLMTVNGTVNKTIVLLLFVFAGALLQWTQFAAKPGLVLNLLMAGSFAGFILALVTIFKKNASPYTAPLYAVFEGLVIGGISAVFEAQYKGITVQAVGLTLGTMFSLLILYKLRIITVTQKFRAGITIATGGIAVFYLVSLVMSFFGFRTSLIYGSTTAGLAVNLVIVIIAALNLLLDFDFVVGGAAVGLPKYMEWYGAFGLTVTLVWLYIEIINLLARRNRQ